jgi:hypothetical protein
MYVSNTTGAMAALDLNFLDPRIPLLYTWKVGTNPWNRDHFRMYIAYNGIGEPRKAAERLLDCIIRTLIGLPLWKNLKKK